MNIAVLFGGPSDEHDVSVASARSVVAACEGHMDAVPVFVSKTGRVWPEEASRRVLAGEDAAGIAAAGAPLVEGLMGLRDASVDAVFPVLHGPFGEDGRVQAVLEAVGLAYVGSGVLGSAVSMDKITSKRVLEAVGVPQTAWREVRAEHWQNDPDGTLDALERFEGPWFVKPSNLGSSVGIGRAFDRTSLQAGLTEAFRFDRRVLVERAVDARELEIGVLGTQPFKTSVIGEIVVDGGGFYDYNAKYQDGSTRLEVPAAVPPDVTERLESLARTAFAAVDGAGLARVDFFYTASGEVLLNEINTLPGFTAVSMYPRLWEASGVAYPDLVRALIDDALTRRQLG
jgi:D-alanine-D-alanine ligase